MQPEMHESGRLGQHSGHPWDYAGFMDVSGADGSSGDVPLAPLADAGLYGRAAGTRLGASVARMVQIRPVARPGPEHTVASRQGRGGRDELSPATTEMSPA